MASLTKSLFPKKVGSNLGASVMPVTAHKAPYTSPNVKFMRRSTYNLYINKRGDCNCFECKRTISVGDTYFTIRMTKGKRKIRCIKCARKLNLI